MEEYSIASEICLGFHCDGCGEYTYGAGSVELSDEQVGRLVSLIRENGGETDIKALDLQEKCPDIYVVLDEAFSNMAREAEYRYWVLNGFENGYYEEPEDFVEGFESEGLFSYEPDLDMIRAELGLGEDDEVTEDDIEEAKRNAFDEWLDDYVFSLGEDEKVAFILDHYGNNIVNPDVAQGDYSICIPQEIVNMASRED